MIQINGRYLFLFGGLPKGKSKYFSTFDASYFSTFDASKQCRKMDTQTGEIIHKAEMVVGGNAFGVSHIGNLVYLIGGLASNTKDTQIASKYDILADKWFSLPKKWKM